MKPIIWYVLLILLSFPKYVYGQEENKLVKLFWTGGQRYYGYKQYDSAILCFSLAIKLDSTNTDYRLMRALSYKDKNQIDSAITDITWLINRHGNNSWNYQRGLCYLQKNDNAAAWKDFSFAIQSDSTKTEYWHGRGIASYRLRKYEQAIPDFTYALYLDSTNEITWYSRASAYQKLKQYEEAMRDYQQYKKNEKDVWAKQIFSIFSDTLKRKELSYIKAIDNYLKNGAYGDVIEQANLILQINKNSKDALYYRGYASYAQKRYKATIKDFKKILAIEAQADDLDYTWYTYNAGFNNLLGTTYSREGYTDTSIIYYTNAIKCDSTNYNYFTNRGLSYFYLRRYDSTKTDLTKSLQLNPSNPNTWNDLALYYSYTGNYQYAIYCLDRSIELSPQKDLSTFLNKLASVYIIQENTITKDELNEYDSLNVSFIDAAKEIIKDNLSLPILQSDNAGKYFFKLLRLLYELQQKRYADAITTYNLLEKTTEFPIVNGSLTYYFQACQYLSLHQPQRALGFLNIAIDLLHPYITLDKSYDNDVFSNLMADLQLKKGTSYEELGNFTQAKLCYQHAAQLNPYGEIIKQSLQNIKTKPTNSIPLSITPPSNLHAVLIATNSYCFYEGIGPLNYCIEDAEALKSILKSQYGLEEKNINTLYNAKRIDILKSLKTVISNLKENENLLIFYAGHGTNSADKQLSSKWILTDSRNEQEYIGPDTLVSLLNHCTNNHVLILSDACFGGNLQINVPRPVHLKSWEVLSSSDYNSVPNKNIFIPAIIKALNENIEKVFDAQQLYTTLKQLITTTPGPKLYPLDGVKEDKTHFYFNKTN